MTSGDQASWATSIPFVCYRIVERLCKMGAILQVVEDAYEAEATFVEIEQHPMRSQDIVGVSWEFVIRLADGDPMRALVNFAFSRPGSFRVQVENYSVWSHTVQIGDIETMAIREVLLGHLRDAETKGAVAKKSRRRNP